MATRKKTSGKGKARRRAVEKSKSNAEGEAAASASKKLGLGSAAQQHIMNNGSIDGRVTCNHGMVPSHFHWHSQKEFLTTTETLKKICSGFLNAFVTEFDGAAGDFLAASHATREKYIDVWNNISEMQFVVSYLLARASSMILEGEIKFACKYASLGCYFQQYLQVELLQTRAFPNFPKLRELYAADEHTLVSFLRRRIPCTCLDEKYKEVKSITKIGLCCSPECPLPCGQTERSLTKTCSRCRAANYCSRKCQVDAWQRHKEECSFYVDVKAKFESTKQQEQ